MTYGEGNEPTVPLPMYDAPKPPWWKRKWVLITAGVLVVLGIIGSASGKDDDPSAAPAPEPTVTVTATPAAPTATATVTKSVQSAPKQAAKSAPKRPVAAAGGGWVMPNQVGQDLQASQDAIQGLTGDPFFYTDSKDASGADRFQILDVDWQVCSQTPVAGAPFDEDTDITFFVVKDWESCP